MPLDTSTYSLALLRLDGRRWNELRRMHAQVSTQAAADGSSYLEMGNTKVLCTVSGPAESRTRGGGGGGGGGQPSELRIDVDVNVAGFAGVERKKRGRGDRRNLELAHALQSALSSTLLTNLYPHSTLAISLHVLAQDGALLAACINAATLALVDAGVPMYDYLVACSAGCTSASAAAQPSASAVPGLASADGARPQADDAEDPLLDLNGLEEQELPHLTVGTLGASEKVVTLVMETRCHVSRTEEMLAVGVDGCKRVRDILDEVVRAHGKRMVGKG